MTELDVALYMRKARATGNFSIEAVFAAVEEELRDELRIARIDAPHLSDGLVPRVAIAWHARQVQAKVLHVTGDINFAGLFAPRQKIVLTVHDCGFLHRPPSLRRALLKALWLDRPVQNARIVTTVSAEIAAEIRRETGLPLPDLRVISNAVSARFRPKPLRAPNGKPSLLQLGTAPNKNVPRLVEALRGLDCTLTIVGRVDESLRALLAASGLAYETHDSVDEETVVTLYERADVVTFPSTYEGFGMPVLEAQAVGRPLLVGDIPVLRDVAGDGAAFADPLDVRAMRAALERLLGDASYRTQLVEQGTRNVRRFSRSAVAARYLAIYRELLR